MKVYHRYKKLPESALHSVTAMGNFDGVHIGHQKILSAAKEIARQSGKPFNVLTFEPHPYAFFKSQSDNFRIKTLRQKAEILNSFGVDNLIIMHFNKDFAQTSAENFIKNILVDGLKISSVVVGKGYKFGHNRLGSTKTLDKEGKKSGFQCFQIEPLMNFDKTERISSSMIRMMIANGEVKKASEILGNPFEMEGFCHKCEYNSLKEKFFMFCLNNFNKYINPRRGIYASKLGIYTSKGEMWYDSVTEFSGHNFSNQKQKLVFGTHIIGEAPELQGKRIKVRLYDFLRPEVETNSIDDWISNLTVDIHWSKIILEQIKNPDMPIFAVRKH
jgi:riboflavin kinase/FMN adenylyltransferase